MTVTTPLPTPLPTPRPAPAAPGPARSSPSRWRRRLYLLGLLPLLAALVLTLKVAVMLEYNQSGRDRLGSGDLAGAADAFASSGVVNVLEPWVAPYDEGTTAYLREEYDDARALLERALADAPAAEQCRVRINLALAHEALGDAVRADGDLADARASWAAGREVLAAGSCGAPAPATGPEDPERPTAAVTVDDRLAEKIRDTRDQRTEQARTPPPRTADEEESLAERNLRAEQLRREAEQRRERPPPRSTPPDDSGNDPPPIYHW